MYDHLEGRLTAKHKSHVVLEVGGIGYKIVAGTQLADSPNPNDEPVRLYVHYRQSEDSVVLYGFLEEAERDLFERLISVSGLGPKLALKILSATPYSELVNQIILGDEESLLKISGLGKKTVLNLLLQLKNKLKPIDKGEEGLDSEARTNLLLQTKQALGSLGYREAEINKALQLLGKEEPLPGLEACIRKALGLLSSFGKPE